MPTRHLPPALARLIHLITWLENALLILLLVVMVGLAGAQIVSRNLLDLSLVGADQLLRLLVLWVALLGAVAASRDGKHIRVDALARWLPPRGQATADAVADLFTIGVCLVLAEQAGRFVAAERQGGALVFGSLPAWVAQLILPAAFTLIALRYLLRLNHHLRQMLGREPRT
jgi:TRAP-type C4-dicarboxylate transport system permease small subunit